MNKQFMMIPMTSDTKTNNGGGKKPGWLASIFIWLGGASPAAAAALSPAQRRILVAIGIGVLVPMTLGFISAAYTVSLLTAAMPLVIAGGLVWAGIVMALEQLILSTMSRNRARRFFQGLLRIGLAAVVGLAISHPLTLRIFHDRLSTHIEQERRREIEMLGEREKADLTMLQDAAAKELANIGQTLPAVSQTGNSSGMSVGVSAGESFPALREGIRSEEENHQRLWDDLRLQEGRLQLAKQKWQDEIDGKLGGRTAKRGEEADRIEKEEVRPLEERVKMAMAAIKASDEKLARLQDQLAEQEQANAARNADIRKRATEIQLASEEQSQRLHEQKAAAVEERRRELAQRQREIQDQHDAEIKRVRDEARNDVLTRTEALHALATVHPFVWWQYGIILLAFLVCDSLPVVVKLFAERNHYDRLMHKEDWLADQNMKALEANYPQQIAVEQEVAMKCAVAEAELLGFSARIQQQLQIIRALSEEVEGSNRRIMELLAAGFESAKDIDLEHVREASEYNLHRLREAFVAALGNLSAQLSHPSKTQAWNCP